MRRRSASGTPAGAWPLSARSRSPRAGSRGRTRSGRPERAGAASSAARAATARRSAWAPRGSSTRCFSALAPARPAGARAIAVLAGGALERAPCLGEEDVVERRSMQAQVSDRDALGVERAHDLGQAAEALRQARGHAVGRGRHLLAEATQHVGYASAIARIRRDRLHAGTADRRLQLARSTLG